LVLDFKDAMMCLNVGYGEFTPYMCIYSTMNVGNMKLYEEYMLDEETKE